MAAWGRVGPIIGAVRRESSTILVLVGAADEPLLAELARSPNVALVRPPDPDHEPDRLTAATAALAEAARRSSPFVLVPADPLAGMAAQWQAMWDLSAGAQGSVGFEEQAAEVLAAWRAKRFELPDYYLVLAPAQPDPSGTLDPRRRSAGGSSPRASAAPRDMYLGPLRAVRPRRVEVVVRAEGEQEQAARVRQALRTLPHGPWWPPLDELIDTARHFFAGSLAESATQ
jgi:hypothetical protein